MFRNIKEYGFLYEIKYHLNNLIRKIYYIAFKLTHYKMYRNPEELIPKDTDYCYSWKNGEEVCPFYKHTLIFPQYAGCEDICMLNGDDCLGDDCKTCGINEPDF